MRFRRLYYSCLGALFFITLSAWAVAFARDPQNRMFAAYYESWLSSETPKQRVDDALIALPPDVNIVILAFMRPDNRYSGHLRLAGTGLNFEYSGSVLQHSVMELRKRNPGTKIFVSVGGEAYTNWQGLNPEAIAHFVSDFALDGVDVDFEPTNPGCKQTVNSISCQTDPLLQRSMKALRSALPSSVQLSLTAAADGAFGEGQWKDAEPKHGPGYGVLVQFLRSPRASEKVDFLNIMAYDAGPEYDPLQGFDAFRNYYKGPILIGFSPPPEVWGGHSYSDKEVTDVLHAALKKGAAGAMLFSLRKGAGRTGLTPFVRLLSRILATNRS